LLVSPWGHHVGFVNRDLDAHGYIVPGLGDAGDRGGTTAVGPWSGADDQLLVERAQDLVDAGTRCAISSWSLGSLGGSRPLGPSGGAPRARVPRGGARPRRYLTSPSSPQAPSVEARTAPRRLRHPVNDTYALSALDIALWDLAAKTAGLPLAKLWGATTDRVAAYGSGGWGSYSIDDLIGEGTRYAAAGCRYYKMCARRSATASR
jgi:hypothetical protein